VSLDSKVFSRLTSLDLHEMSSTLTRCLKVSAVTQSLLRCTRLPVVCRSPSWRSFAASRRTGVAVSEMKAEDFASLRVDGARLMNDIHSTSEWGKGERWGE